MDSMTDDFRAEFVAMVPRNKIDDYRIYFGGGAAIRQRELEFIGVIRSFDYEERTTADLLTFSVSDRGFQVQGDVFKALPCCRGRLVLGNCCEYGGIGF